MKNRDMQNIIREDLNRHGGLLSEGGVRSIMRTEGSVLLESSYQSASTDETLVFLDPVETIRAIRIHEVVPALVRAQVYLEQGLYVAGYVSFESAPAFLPVPERDPSDGPPFLLWFGVYKRPIRVSRTATTNIIPQASRKFTIGQIEPAIRKAEYLQGMEAIRRYLEAGHSYQVNYTFPVDGRWTGDHTDLYCRLRQNQPVSYGSIITHNNCTIMSFSPELFFRIEKNTISLKPMKGTAPRGKSLEEDVIQKERLQQSEKDRAENRMIVDLLRNDVGRIAEPGSVSVRSFFDIETYESILQATSTIQARLKGKPALVDLFTALFPSGSVTGAPKIETMKIIHEVESSPRGVYTGAIGYAGPEGDMTFNVAIRTLVADEKKGRFRLPVGSGVTIASDPEKEFKECLQKSSFVTRGRTAFKLFETILWIPGRGYQSLNRHMRRLHRSAEYFGWMFSEEAFHQCLNQAVKQADAHGESPRRRVRIILDWSGSYEAIAEVLGPVKDRVLVGISGRTISSQDRFQYHKTTNRQTYDIVMEEASAKGWFDALVFNERGELAEGARTNVFIEKEGVLFTPPISAGILPGTMRETVLASGEHPVEERTLFRQDLIEADRIFLSNALRGLLEAELV